MHVHEDSLCESSKRTSSSKVSHRFITNAIKFSKIRRQNRVFDSVQNCSDFTRTTHIRVSFSNRTVVPSMLSAFLLAARTQRKKAKAVRIGTLHILVANTRAANQAASCYPLSCHPVRYQAAESNATCRWSCQREGALKV